MIEAMKSGIRDNMKKKEKKIKDRNILLKEIKIRLSKKKIKVIDFVK